MSRILLPLLLLVATFVAIIWAAELGYGPLVITKEGEQKIILRLGDPVRVLAEPGLALRIPLLDSVETFDRRLQYLNARPVEMLIARGEKLIVDYYVVWHITDPLEFKRNFPLGMQKAEDRIQETVNSLVGKRIGALSLDEILARAEILDQLDEEGSEGMEGTGVAIVDVRLNRTELPRNAEPAAYEQMREQRRALARESRARGDRQARTIRAEADRDARTIVARARSEGEVIRGEGDAESARIYAEAYNRDPEFYAFLRSLEAYRKSLGEGTTMVLPPDHDFFRYLGAEGANGEKPAPPPTGP